MFEQENNKKILLYQKKTRLVILIKLPAKKNERKRFCVRRIF